MMKVRFNLSFLIIILLIIISYLLSEAIEKVADQLPDIEIPLYPSAYEVNKLALNKAIKSVFYKVKIKFPAKEVILFYENKFNEMGFISYSEDGYGNRKWQNFNPKTGIWESTFKPPARYIATWVDKKQIVRIVLVIDAYDEEGPMLVNISVTRFFDFSKLNEFNKRLERGGKIKEFYNLLEKYTNKNRKVDLEKALRENPQNEDLKEFIRLWNNGVRFNY